MLFIGSIALQQHIDIERNSRDIDIIGTYDEVSAYVKSLEGELTKAIPTNGGKKYVFFKGDYIVEAEIAWEGSLAEEFLMLMKGSKYATLNGLYALKMSHRFLRNSKHFLKTMNDIHLMRKHGAEISDDLADFYKKRVKETYDYSHPKLNVTKKDFFNGDGIEYVFDHDSIHGAIKLQEMPAYNYFKADISEVFVSKELFNELSDELKLNSVLEESYVLALERSQIPFPDLLTPKQSFDIALQKVCTSITSGWWRNYAWEHYYDAQAKYDDSYCENFFSKVKKGEVLPFVA